MRRERLASENSGEHSSFLMKSWMKIEAVFRPVKLIGGFLLILVAILIWVSMLLTGIDKAKNSVCKSHCGYILGHIQIFNPLNWIFVQSAKVFPIDYVLFLLLVLLFFASSVVGIATVGIRFLWLKIFTIRKGHTSPQALLMATVMLLLIALAINYSMAMMVAPQYSHYGPQTFCDHPLRHPGEQPNCTDHPNHIRACTELSENPAAKNVCTPSVISTFLDRVTVNFSFFGVVDFWAQFVFLGNYTPSSFIAKNRPGEYTNASSGVFLIVFITTLFRTPKLDEYQLDQDAEDDEEEGLLASTGRRFGATWQDITGRASQGTAAPARHVDDED